MIDELKELYNSIEKAREKIQKVELTYIEKSGLMSCIDNVMFFANNTGKAFADLEVKPVRTTITKTRNLVDEMELAITTASSTLSSLEKLLMEEVKNPLDKPVWIGGRLRYRNHHFKSPLAERPKLPYQSTKKSIDIVLYADLTRNNQGLHYKIEHGWFKEIPTFDGSIPDWEYCILGQRLLRVSTCGLLHSCIKNPFYWDYTR
jgi:hypothetical protein